MFAFQSGEPGNEASASHTGNILASFPAPAPAFHCLLVCTHEEPGIQGLPHFTLPFALTIMHKSGRGGK